MPDTKVISSPPMDKVLEAVTENRKNVEDANIDTSQRLSLIESAIIQQVESNKQIAHAMRNQQMGIQGLMEKTERILEEFKDVVSSVIDIRNGVVPPTFMMISDHQEQMKQMAEQNAKLTEASQLSNDKLFNKMIWAFGILLGLSMTISIGGGAVAAWLRAFFLKGA